MKQPKYYVGVEITINGRWFEIVEKCGSNWFVRDEDGEEKEASEESFD